MTRERLIEALGAHSPDGVDAAVQRVREAAGQGELRCKKPGRCLLAVAWRASVETGFWRPRGRREWVNHDCFDVVFWFDRFCRPRVDTAPLDQKTLWEARS